MRCSAYISNDKNGIVIDVGPDFRTQALREGIKELDGVFLTHEHNDHVAGMDDLRPLIFRKGRPMPVFAEERVLEDVRTRYSYAFEKQPYPGAPSFELIAIKPGDEFHFGALQISAQRVYHGKLPILAFVVQDRLAYLTDTNEIPRATKERLHGIEYLILDALRRERHYSHHSLQEAIDAAASIQASKTFLIHLSHMMGPTSDWEGDLPENVFPSYDQLTIELQKE